MIKSIKTFFKRIWTMPKEYRLMKFKAEHYDKMLASIDYKSETLYNYIEDGCGCILRNDIKEMKKHVYLNPKKMLRSGGIELGDVAEIHIIRGDT